LRTILALKGMVEHCGHCVRLSDDTVSVFRGAHIIKSVRTIDFQGDNDSDA